MKQPDSQPFRIKEKFLQALWQKKAFNPLLFKDTEGNAVEILDFGQLNTSSGPDFHSAKIMTQGLIFFGNIEFHVKASDWYLHQHHKQKEYQSIILHVVFENDREITELKNRNIPTIELKNYMDAQFIEQHKDIKLQDFTDYEDLFGIKKLDENFARETVLEKLQEKDEEIRLFQEATKNDHEAVLFHKTAYAFGLKVNAEVFLQIAQSIDFKIIKKLSCQPFQMEALLMGRAGLLEENSPDAEPWFREFSFVKNKFQLGEEHFSAKLAKVMPASFPTIRLSQLAALYSAHQNLFSKIINARKVDELKAIFKDIKASAYWDSHYFFGKKAEEKQRKLSADFTEIILLNAVFPVMYSYHRDNPEMVETILSFYKEMKPEKNSIIKQWKNTGAEINSALDSQAFLYLYKKLSPRKGKTTSPKAPQR